MTPLTRSQYSRDKLQHVHLSESFWEQATYRKFYKECSGTAGFRTFSQTFLWRSPSTWLRNVWEDAHDVSYGDRKQIFILALFAFAFTSTFSAIFFEFLHLTVAPRTVRRAYWNITFGAKKTIHQLVHLHAAHLLTFVFALVVVMAAYKSESKFDIEPGSVKDFKSIPQNLSTPYLSPITLLQAAKTLVTPKIMPRNETELPRLSLLIPLPSSNSVPFSLRNGFSAPRSRRTLPARNTVKRKTGPAKERTSARTLPLIYIPPSELFMYLNARLTAAFDERNKKIVPYIVSTVAKRPQSHIQLRRRGARMSLKRHGPLILELIAPRPINIPASPHLNRSAAPSKIEQPSMKRKIHFIHVQQLAAKINRNIREYMVRVGRSLSSEFEEAIMGSSISIPLLVGWVLLRFLPRLLRTAKKQSVTIAFHRAAHDQRVQELASDTPAT